MPYFRPLLRWDVTRPAEAVSFAGTPAWFDTLEQLERGRAPALIPVRDAPDQVIARLVAPRPTVAGLDMGAPRVMGILNVTPDSFSDGGRYEAPEAAAQQARTMIASGVDMIDVGGESTRPGAQEVPAEAEIARVTPVLAAIRDLGAPISIDTRKAGVAQAALDAGAALVNDVSAMTFDPSMAELVARRRAPVCLMHAQGAPETMQDDPRYDDVVLDVYDGLAARIAEAEAAGIARSAIIADPGIGFGKRLEHNLALLNRLSLFHTLGVPILLGASRKRFIGTIGETQDAADRVPGSVAVALAGIAQGVQIVRVHDVAQTAQALRLWRAIHEQG